MDKNFSFLDVKGATEPTYLDDGVALYDDYRKFGAAVPDIYLTDMAALVFVRQGYMYTEVDGANYRVSEHQIMFCRPGHTMRHPSYSDDFVAHGVLISMRFAQNIMSVAGNIWDCLTHTDNNPVFTLPESDMELLRGYYSLLKRETDRTDNRYYREVVTLITRAMICSIIDALRHELPAKAEGADAASSGTHQALSLFRRFQRMLNDERNTERKISYYSERLCVSNKYLSTVCKRVSGRTAHQWICDSIVNGIDSYLRYSGKSAKEVSDLYGFPNLSFFSRYVKKHLGYAPTDIISRRNL